MLSKNNLKGCIEALTCSAQEQALISNYVKFHIDKTAESPQCRTCRIENNTVSHIVSECKMLVQEEYKKAMAMYAGILIGDYAKKMA